MWRGSDDSWVCAYSHEYIFFVNNYLWWGGIESEEDAAAHLSVLYPSDDSYDAHGMRGGGATLLRRRPTATGDLWGMPTSSSGRPKTDDGELFMLH